MKSKQISTLTWSTTTFHVREKERKVLGMREDLGEKVLLHKIRESGRGIRESGRRGKGSARWNPSLTRIQSMTCSNLVSQIKIKST